MKKSEVIKLYANENFPLPVVLLLRNAGLDVLTIQETGYGQQAVSDEAVLKFASANSRAVITFNRRHFISLHQSNPDHNGIIVCTFDINFERLTKNILDILSREKNLEGKLLRVIRR